MGLATIDECRGLPEGTPVEMAATLSNLGAVLIKKGSYAEAEPFVRKGLELRRKMLGDAHPDSAMSLFCLSDLHQAQLHHRVREIQKINLSVSISSREACEMNDRGIHWVRSGEKHLCS